MSDIAIKVENISKRYRIGLKEELHDTFIGALTSWVKFPIRNFKQLRKLTKFDDNPGKKPDPILSAPSSMPSSQSDDVIWALRDISFELKHGEVLGIIGRNGAGKSTLLKVLCRIVEPTSGNAFLNGRVASLLEVGTGFHPELTGRENAYLNGTILGMKKTEVDRKFDEIVDFSGVEKFIDTPVKRYSSGMCVRLAFAVAAHLEPEILLIDEVLAVGDVGFQKKCLGKMKSITGEGRTVLFVSHNMGMIRTLCRRAILLIDGNIAANGGSNDVVTKYLSSWNTEDRKISEIIWTKDEKAPSCDELKLCSIRVVDPAGHVQDTFDVDKSISIEISYNVLTTLRGMRVLVSLTTEDGMVVFVSTDQDHRPNVMEPGRYKSIVTIPGRLLNQSKYFVRIAFGIPGIRILINWIDLISFSCEKKQLCGSYIPQTWNGVISPELKWTYEKLD